MNYIQKITFFCLITLSTVYNGFGQKLPPFLNPQAERWADSVLQTMKPDERISQLIMVAAWSNKDSTHIKEIRKLISDWGIGGVCFFQGGPMRQANLTNNYQKLSKIPLMVGIDGEWGLAMRLDSTIRFPRQMTLSAIKDQQLIYDMAQEIARECKIMGIHVNFAPDADINNNPSNPIIGSRSFGDDREDVYLKSLLYMNGLQDNHILATGKHFPGHGNADSDSHLTLPLINQPISEMDSIELYPFKKLINEGLGSMMVAHLSVPALDSIPNNPSTLSKEIVTGLLKNKLGFQGLIFTDALNMKGVSALYKPGIVDKLAFMSGNDVLLYCEDVRKAVQQIHLAVENCEIKQEEIDVRAKKVLMAKYWTGLNNYSPIDTSNLLSRLNSNNGQFLQRSLFEKAITVLKNQDSILPLQRKDTLRIAVVSIGEKKDNAFQAQLKMYGKVDVFAEEKDAPLSVLMALYSFLSNYDYVILSLHSTTMKASTNFGISEGTIRFVDSVLIKYPTIFVDFGNSYTLSKFKNIQSAQAILLAYEDFPLMQQLAAQTIYGGIEATGTLPVTVNKELTRKSGEKTIEPIRLKYSLPEEVGMSSDTLSQIDTIVSKAIAANAIPGCQVLVARKGVVIYNKSFGTKTYNSTDTVRNSDLYDIASVTKVVGTALATMKLYDLKKIDLNHPLSKFFTPLKSTNKKALLVKEILAHQAGLVPWIPFYKKTMVDTFLVPGIFSKIKSEDYPVRVADSMYMETSYSDSLIDWVFDSQLNAPGKYVYSDLGPILMMLATEKITGQSFDKYISNNFYNPLGLSRITYNPREKFSLSEIVPTENDLVFRKQLLRGDVHDPAAAMMGGISGNAGIFSNANDLAVIMQMLLNKGSYGGKNYIHSSTVDLFTRQQFPLNNNRRGLLFDKPELDPNKASPCAKEAGPNTFGHQGFTGTCVWADPDSELIYIFLSNRVNPDATNEKLTKMNVRTTIQSAIYHSIIN